ncbi:hypothetical protein H072_6692 [Dactylellina haptotyla CBS 200.50]|uniref:Peptidase S8/S53 domain-containing protein n=1 Tax=Dactylellina haptotyla (strain CBS 200.50) TaxID=1284197 RepID=S8A9D8_DACHA|nr:hypothetical protein H072_6692 [Dactylellina haptotyla CBS 200.50]
MLMNRLLSLLVVTGLSSQALAAPLLKVLNLGAANAILDKYIIVFKDTTSDAAITSHKSLIGSLHTGVIKRLKLTGAKALGIEKEFNFASGFRGYSGGFDPDTLKQILLSPDISYVEQDGVVKTNAVQNNAEWGLERVSNKAFTNDGSFKYSYNDATAGAGVSVYIIDTGIQVSHNEFEGRASWGYDFITNSPTGQDENGHGTHCAGTIGGKTYGVAKKAKLVAVRVLDGSGSGSNSGVIAGMQWVADNAIPNKSVASMSLGGLFSQATNDAVNAIYTAGITIVVAAGNDAQLATFYSPASTPNAITVGAMNIDNKIAYFSNFGPGVDVFAPGVNVKSSFIGPSNAETAVYSGTSMATPHVAGLSAYVISSAPGGSLTPSAVTMNITNGAITGQLVAQEYALSLPLIGIITQLTDGPVSVGTPNKIAYNGYLG